MTGGTVVTMDANADRDRRRRGGGRGDTIVAVGPAARSRSRYARETTIDVRGQIVMPGLINTHTHVPMVLYRGLADDLALMDWLNKYIFPAEKATVSPDFVRIGTRLAALEMIESGTTTFADMYYFEDDIADVTHEAGLRARARTVRDQVSRRRRRHAGTGARAGRGVLPKWKDDPLITPAVAPHAPYTVDGRRCKAARALANKYNVPLLIHLAETRDEIKIIAGRASHDRRRSTSTASACGTAGRSRPMPSGSTPPTCRCCTIAASAWRTIPRAT